MRLPKDWTPIEPGEVDTVTIDFAKELATGETLSSCIWTADVAADSLVTDPTPSSMLQGTNVIVDTKAAHMVVGRVDGATYVLEATVVTSANRTLKNHSHIPCRAPR